MKDYHYNKEKNDFLRKDRNIDFKEVIKALNNERLLDVIDNPNIEKYPNQRIFLVKIRQHIFAVPFIEEEEYIFLKTIYPSQKYTRKYLRKKLKVKK